MRERASLKEARQKKTRVSGTQDTENRFMYRAGLPHTLRCLGKSWMKLSSSRQGAVIQKHKHWRLNNKVSNVTEG